MARLIDADALILELSERMRSIDNDVICGTVEKPYAYLDCAISKAVSDYLSRCPTIDAEPVRHGRWEWITEDVYRCENCGERVHVKEVMGMPVWEYCPDCGAKMDGGKDDLL